MALRSQRMALGTTNRLAVNAGSGGEVFSTGIGGFPSPKYRPLTGTGTLQPFSPGKKSPERPKTMSPGYPKGRVVKPGTPTESHSRRNSISSAEKYFSGERQAFSPQGIQNGMETKKTTPRVLSWSTVKDRKLDAESTRIKHSTHETKPFVRTIPQTLRIDASALLDRQSGHFFPLERLLTESQEMTEQTRKSKDWVELSKVSWGEVFPGNYTAAGEERQQTDRNTKSFSVEGWGPGNHIDFDAFPTSQFMPDVSALLTSRIITNKTPSISSNHSNGSLSQRSAVATKWDPFTMTSTQRISISNANAKDVVDSIKASSKRSRDGALRSRDMVKLQESLVFQHGSADALRMLRDSELQEGHMKGVIAKPTNFKRPFSPVDFSVLTTSKQGRPMGEPLIGVGTHVPAGLPTALRYNQRPEMIEAVNHTVTRKGHSNNFPFHSGQSCEGYIKQPRILGAGDFIRCSHTLKPRVFRPSFDKGVELDGQLAQGRRPRDLTLYYSVGTMKN